MDGWMDRVKPKLIILKCRLDPIEFDTRTNCGATWTMGRIDI